MTIQVDSNNHEDDGKLTESKILKILTRIGLQLDIPIDPSDAQTTDQSELNRDPLGQLIRSALQAGIILSEIRIESAIEAIGTVQERHPVVLALADGTFVILEKIQGRKIESAMIAARVEAKTIKSRVLTRLLHQNPVPRILVAKKQFECESISAATTHQHHGHHPPHPTPLRRFLGLLNLERRDVWLVVLFAFVSGILALATPLAIESLVNVVSWGTQLQPLFVLGAMLLTCLGIAGVLKLLQTIVVELIQRRQFVRIVSDLSHRFPRANLASLQEEYPRELANRVFDIMTIQKATAVLLLDGVSIVLTTMLGMTLLAFYHPFLLGFDIVLLISMLSITWVLGRGGIRTSIEESIAKYRVAHWLQDVIAQPSIFKISGGERLAIQRADQLTAQYIKARQRQFRVVIRQVGFAIALQVVASTSVLALGGWLVIQGSLTLGQLVASELIITVVVGAFAKAGKSLEKFYDLMAGVDKVGHLIDVQVDRRMELGRLSDGPAEVRWGDLLFQSATHQSQIHRTNIVPGSRVAIVGDDVAGRTNLAKTLAGLTRPSSGIVQIAGLDSAEAAASGEGRLVAYAGGNDIFHGTIRENIDLGRSGISYQCVREATEVVGLSDSIIQLTDGLQTKLQTGGHPLSPIDVTGLIFARAIVTQPKLVIVDRLLDELGAKMRDNVWQALTKVDAPWTLIVVTDRPDIAALCQVQIDVKNTSP